MNMHLFKFFASMTASLVLLVSPFAFADATTIPTSFCPDYSLQSVKVAIAGSSSAIKAGSNLSIYGGVSNTNPFSIVDGKILVKVYKIVNAKLSAEDPANIRMVDRFIVPLRSTVSAHGTSTFSTQWQFPFSLPNGTYKVATSFVSGDEFYFGSVALSDQGAPSFKVTVTGGSSNEVYFDKQSVAYNSIAVAGNPSPNFSKSQNVVFSVMLKNSSATKVSVPLKWKLSTGAGVGDISIVDSRIELVDIPANGSTKASYAITDASSNEYHIIAEAKYGDAKTLLVSSFARQGIAGASIRFAGLDDAKIFGCIASSYPFVDGTVAVSITDKQGKAITADSFTLSTSNLTGFAIPVSLPNSPSGYVLSLLVKDASGKILDRSSTTYTGSSLRSATVRSRSESISYIAHLTGMTAGALGVIIGLLFILRRKKSPRNNKVS